MCGYHEGHDGNAAAIAREISEETVRVDGDVLEGRASLETNLQGGSDKNPAVYCQRTCIISKCLPDVIGLCTHESWLTDYNRVSVYMLQQSIIIIIYTL